MADTAIDAAWTLEEALEFIRRVTPDLRGAGFCVGLTGSVLLTGASMHDLDIVIYPLRSTPKTDFEHARESLRHLGLSRYLDALSVQRAWRRKGSEDEKEVEIWQYNRQRVDIFFLR